MAKKTVAVKKAMAEEKVKELQSRLKQETRGKQLSGFSLCCCDVHFLASLTLKLKTPHMLHL